MLTLMDDVRYIGESLYMNRQNNHYLSVVQETAFDAAVTCYICSGTFVHTKCMIMSTLHRTSAV